MTRTRTPAAVLLVCLLAVVAGCSGLPGGSEAATAYTGPDEALNLTQLHQDNADAIERAGSYTLVTNYTIGNETTTSIVANGTLWVDVAADRGRSTQFTKFIGEQRTARYTDGNTTWQRSVQDPSGEAAVRYREAAAPYEGEVQPIDTDTTGNANEFSDAVAWERAEVYTEDGTSLTRYETSEVANQSALPTFGPAQNASVASIDGTLVVTADGVIREYELDFSIEQDDGDGGRRTVVYHLGYAISAVGDTVVEEPDWLSKAKQSDA